MALPVSSFESGPVSTWNQAVNVTLKWYDGDAVMVLTIHMV